MDMEELHFQDHPMLDDISIEERYNFLIRLLQCYFIVCLIICILLVFSLPY